MNGFAQELTPLVDKLRRVVGSVNGTVIHQEMPTKDEADADTNPYCVIGCVTRFV
jgi:hypothetical protein